MVMFTIYDTCRSVIKNVYYFPSATMIFTETVRIRITVRFWISMPDDLHAIYIFTITAEILARSLGNLRCQ